MPLTKVQRGDDSAIYQGSLEIRMRRVVVWVVALACLMFSGGVGFANQEGIGDAINSLGTQQFQDSLESDADFGAKEIAATNSWVQTLSIADWLGPMAPVALSPFFGMAILSGLALFGPEWVTNNALLGASGPLQNHVLFFAFIGLTLLTSLPRLSKVSKPFAQAMDQLETYSVIVILLAIKFLAGSSATEGTPEVAMVQLGIFQMTADTLLMIAMVINIIVINSVKFFFEFLVWLTPVPLLDAIFEASNKSICAGMMALYAYSPTLATCLNLVLLAVAMLVFRWVSRRIRFYRTMVMDPLLARFWPGYGQPKASELIVFPKDEIGPFAAQSRLRMTQSENGWLLSEANWWMPSKSHELTADASPSVHRGWVMHRIELTDNQATHALRFSRRYDKSLGALAEQMGLAMADSSVDESHVQASVEFA